MRTSNVNVSRTQKMDLLVENSKSAMHITESIYELQYSLDLVLQSVIDIQYPPVVNLYVVIIKIIYSQSCSYSKQEQ